MYLIRLVSGLGPWFHTDVNVIGDLIAELGTVCAGLADLRKGPRRDGDYAMADIPAGPIQSGTPPN